MIKAAKRPIYCIRELGVEAISEVPDYQIFKAICKASNLRSYIPTGKTSRQASQVGLDNELAMIDCI